MKKLILISWVVLFVLGGSVLAAELYVPSEYGTIRAAINAAVGGDTVIVADGTYTGPGNRDIDFLGKAITVRSENGPENCIINCWSVGRGFYFANGEDASSIVDGFTIVWGRNYCDPQGPCPISTYGGGIYCGGNASPTIRNCIIGYSYASFGGGIFSYGSPTIINCIICNNSGVNGAGIWYSKNTKILNCTIVDNSSSMNSGAVDGSGGLIINSILWGNVPNQIDGNITVRYSDVQGGWPGEGNINTNPLFVDAPSSDYHLSVNSPCIDVGDNSVVDNSTDLDGNPRIVNGIVDMGAYELQPIYVDDDAPGDPGPGNPNVSDPLENGTQAHPFDTIQEGIDAAQDGHIVLVWPGVYTESIDFLGKNITLTSTDPTNSDVVKNTIIEGAVQFSGAEDANCMLTGFSIRDLFNGTIYGHNTQATISYCVISGNGPCGATAIRDCDGTISNCLITDNTTIYLCGVYPVIFRCHGLIKNCTIANNDSGVGVLAGGTTTMENCIIYNNGDLNDADPQVIVGSGGTVNISYCDVQGGYDGISGGGTVNWGLGNIDTDPCFVRLGDWEYTWPWELVEGDYRLKSEGWRWDVGFTPPRWGHDYITSRCIDAGNPGCTLGDELMTVPPDPDNEWGVNIRINMGTYGGTAEASMAPHGWALLADLSNDGIASYLDLAGQVEDWLIGASEQPGDLNRDGVVNGIDFAMLGEDWLSALPWAE